MCPKCMYMVHNIYMFINFEFDLCIATVTVVTFMYHMYSHFNQGTINLLEINPYSL